MLSADHVAFIFNDYAGAVREQPRCQREKAIYAAIEERCGVFEASVFYALEGAYAGMGGRVLAEGAKVVEVYEAE
jgi:hypothetical protein